MTSSNCLVAAMRGLVIRAMSVPYLQ